MLSHLCSQSLTVSKPILESFAVNGLSVSWVVKVSPQRRRFRQSSMQFLYASLPLVAFQTGNWVKEDITSLHMLKDYCTLIYTSLLYVISFNPHMNKLMMEVLLFSIFS